MDTPIIIETVNAKAEHLEDKVALWTSLGRKELERGIRWFASRSMPEQAQIIAKSETLLPGLRKNQPGTADDEHLRYVAFILSIRRAGFDLIRKRGYRIDLSLPHNASMCTMSYYTTAYRSIIDVVFYDKRCRMITSNVKKLMDDKGITIRGMVALSGLSDKTILRARSEHR